MALLMAMLVIVLATLLVAGAITFTGVERSAARLQSNEDTMNGCVQAARNLFLARVRVLLGNAPGINFTHELQPTSNDGQLIASTGHYDDYDVPEPTLKHVERVDPSSLGEARAGAGDESNKVGTAALVANYYRVTAVCRERYRADDSAPWQIGAEREVEFIVRVGL
jgi:hypothetical protein